MLNMGISGLKSQRTDNSIKNHWNSYLKKKLDYYLRTGELPHIQKTFMPNTARDTGNLHNKQFIYCSNHGLERNVKNLEETVSSVSPCLPFESSKAAGQHDSANMEASVSDSHTSIDVSVRESDGSDTGECSVQVSEILLVHDTSDSGVKLKTYNSNRDVSQNEGPCEKTPDSFPSRIHFLCYKPPQLEDLVISGTTSPLCNLTPYIYDKYSGKQIIESFLKNAATSFSNTPSIIKRRGAHRHLPSDTMKSNEDRMNDGYAPNVGNDRGNTGVSGFSVPTFLSSPCASNGDFYNHKKDYNVSPPYRIWRKRKAAFKSVEKQLDFSLFESNSNSNTN